MNPLLVIGNKNYSSWSLRPWLLMRQFDVAFDEIRLPLDTPEFYQRVPRYSPTGRVPVLHDGERVIWDSLAICEYVNERWLHAAGWPQDLAVRAVARAAAAEMHSGFPALRSQLPMNCRRQPRAPHWDDDALRDIDRVLAVWRDLRLRFGGDGPFLCGGFSIVDAMFAPVCVRFRSYGVTLDDTGLAYTRALLALPAFIEWETAALAETERVAHDEA